MLILRMIREILSVFRSGMTAHEIAVGACLGILAGTIPFSSFWMLGAVFFLMMIFRASFTSYFLIGGLVKLLAVVVTPLTFRLGDFLLNGSMASFFETLVNTPGIALLDLHRYVVTGGILFALIAALPVYLLVYFLINRYRKTAVAWSEKSSKWKGFKENKFIKFISWLFFGKRGDYEEALETNYSPFRKKAIIAIVVFAAVFALFTFFFGDAVAKAGFESGLSLAFDADVTIEDVGLSVTGGSLSFDNLFVWEKNKDGQISHATLLSGDLDSYELWRRNLVFDEIVIERAEVSAVRDREGNFNFGRSERSERDRKVERSEEEVFTHLGDLWEHRELGEDIVNAILDALFPEPTPESRAERRRELILKRRFTDIYAEQLLEQDRPFVVINDFWVRGFDITLRDEGSEGSESSFEGLTLHATNLSSNPLLYKKDSVVELFTGPEEASKPGGEHLRGFDLQLTLKWSLPDPLHELTIRLKDLPAVDVCGNLNEGDRIRVSDGTIGMVTTASLGCDSFTCESAISLTKLVLEPGEKGKNILGLPGDQFCAGLNAYLEVNPLPVNVEIDGPYAAPHFRIDEKELLARVKEGLAGTVKKMAQEKLDEEKEKLKADAQKKLDDEKKKLKEEANKGIRKGMEGLFGGKKKK